MVREAEVAFVWDGQGHEAGRIGQRQLRGTCYPSLLGCRIDSSSRNIGASKLSYPQGSIAYPALALDVNLKFQFRRPSEIDCPVLYAQQKLIQQIPSHLSTNVLVDYDHQIPMTLPENAIGDRLSRMAIHIGRDPVKGETHRLMYRASYKWPAKGCEGQIDW